MDDLQKWAYDQKVKEKGVFAVLDEIEEDLARAKRAVERGLPAEKMVKRWEEKWDYVFERFC